MTDIRELRLALAEKLEHRRQLMTERDGLKRSLSKERQRVDFLEKVALNPMVNMVLEECADEIVRRIFDEATKASRFVADETFGSGDYEIGLSIPALHIRHRIARIDLDSRFDDRVVPDGMMQTKRVTYDGRR